MGLVLEEAKKFTAAIWENTDVNSAKKKLFTLKMHMPYRDWHAIRIEHLTWVYCDSQPKVKSVMQRLGMAEATVLKF